jgi:hypothetical protein
MKKLLIALVLFLSVISAEAGINQSCSQFTAAGAPHYTAKAGDQ